MAAEPDAVASKRASTRRTSKWRRPRSRASTGRTTLLLRFGILAVLVLVGVLYYRPLTNYVETRAALEARRAEVHRLREERQRLDVRLERSATDEALTREARRLGLVRPGERLFIVKGIAGWRRSIHPDG